MSHERAQDEERGSLKRDRAHGILDDVLSELPGVVYRCRNDRDWTMLGLTRSVLELTGYEATELIEPSGIPFSSLIHPDDRERVWNEIQEAVASDDPYRVVYRIETRAGEERWVLEQGRAVREDGETVLTGYIQDVGGPLSRRLAGSRAEVERARRQAAQLGLLQSVTAIANEEHRLESALRAAVPAVCGALGFAAGHVFLGDDDGEGPLRSSDIWHLEAGVDGLDAFRRATDAEGWSREEGLPGRVMASGRAEWVEDVKGDPALSRIDERDPSPVRSGVGVPVMSGERTLAMLEFYTADPGARDPEIEGLLEQVGVQLGRVWERERAAREQRASARRFRQLAENIDAGFWLSTPEGETLYLSSAFEKLTGVRDVADDWREYMDRIHPDDRERMAALFADEDRAPYEVEYRIVRPGGEVRWLRQKAFPIHDGRGRVHRIGGLTEDVTESRRGRERLERILDSLAEGVVILDRSGVMRYANEAGASLLPFERNDLVGRAYDDSGWDITDVDGRPIDPEELPAARTLRSGNPVRDELIVVHGDDPTDEAVIFSINAVPYAPDGGEVTEVIVSFADVTERERFALELRESEERFRQIAERVDSVFWISSPEKDVMEYVSPAYADIWGRAPEELYGDPGRWLEAVHPDDRERVRRALPKQVRGDYEEEYRVVRPDGDVRWVWDRAFPIRDDDGEVHRIIGIVEDVTGRRTAEEELRRAEEHFRALIENSVDSIGILDEDLVTRYISPAVTQILGYEPEEIIGTHGRTRVHPDDRQRALDELRALRERPGDTLVQTVRMVAKDGSVRHLEARSQNLLHEPAVSGIVVNLRDVTEKEELESQLRQAQKMEAVGRLAGGIAHDFNNLLTVIRSQSDLLLMDLGASSPLTEEMEVIRGAADRAAELTGQLLAFSREQVLRPRTVDLNEVIAGMRQLLARVLGEDISIRTELAEGLPPIRVDPGQLEQVVLNLAVNARDAMPEGGALHLCTSVEELRGGDAGGEAGLEPGVRVCLDVRDTGTGMDEETRTRIFEPFFSTKEEREGTGLGLAVSYGIVKQSGGTIEVESEAGRGATFTVRFPATEGTPISTEEAEAPVAVREGEVTGTVLIIEDDSHVRRVARRILERAGFDVRGAPDAEAGLEILDAGASDVDLVLTDLVLPGAGGRHVVDRVQERYPNVALVVMSGYAEGSPGTRGDLPEEVAFIQKPFSPAGLVEAVRKGLGTP